MLWWLGQMRWWLIMIQWYLWDVDTRNSTICPNMMEAQSQSESSSPWDRCAAQVSNVGCRHHPSKTQRQSPESRAAIWSCASKKHKHCTCSSSSTRSKHKHSAGHSPCRTSWIVVLPTVRLQLIAISGGDIPLEFVLMRSPSQNGPSKRESSVQ